MEEVSLAPSLGPLAQLVEQLAFNQLVARSSRARPTIFELGPAITEPTSAVKAAIYSVLFTRAWQ